jgi:eukaryotic-like serine/threonine-protein kinase
VDERADIYSIGVMLHEAITGMRPDADPQERDPRPYRLHGTGATDLLDALLQRCLATDPQQRLGSAAVLAAELLPLLRASGSETAG